MTFRARQPGCACCDQCVHCAAAIPETFKVVTEGVTTHPDSAWYCDCESNRNGTFFLDRVDDCEWTALIPAACDNGDTNTIVLRVQYWSPNETRIWITVYGSGSTIDYLKVFEGKVPCHNLDAETIPFFSQSFPDVCDGIDSTCYVTTI